MLGSPDCDVWATPRSLPDDDVVDVEVDAVDATETIIENGSAVSHPLQLLTFTVRVANGSKKVGFILTPTGQPRVYLVHSVHDVQSVPTRVEKGEDLDRWIVRAQS